jgi:hypothetical protein
MGKIIIRVLDFIAAWIAIGLLCIGFAILVICYGPLWLVGKVEKWIFSRFRSA